MKHLLLCALLALAATLATAQVQPAVPNAGFENWSITAAQVPTGWSTSDQLYASSGIPFPTNTVSRSSDSRSGTYAARLQTGNLLGNLLPSFVVLGTVRNFNNTNQMYPGGVPYTARPAALQFWYKYTGTVADTAEAGVLLTRGTGTSKQELGAGGTELYAATAPAYRLGQATIGYGPNGLAPDSLYMYFATNGGSAGGALVIDDVVLTNTVTAAAEPQLKGALVAYPNPSTDGQFKVRAELDFDIVAAPGTVTDATGRTVLRLPAVPAQDVANGRLVDLRGQRPGIYLLRLQAARGTVVRRLSVL